MQNTNNVVYPLRMKSKSSGNIVDFYSLHDVIVVESPRFPREVGMKSRVISWNTESNWEPYGKPKVSLKEIYANY